MQKLPPKYKGAGAGELHQDVLDTLHKLNPEFAKYVQDKYESERTDFEKALMEAVPSTKVRHWAKTSCNKCFGKGTMVINGEEHTCRCVDRNYVKWFEKFRDEYYKRDNT